VENKFEQFIKERQYLTNVTPSTIEWYRQSLAWLSIESPSDADLKSFVMRMREKGLKPSGCNCRIRAVNAYLKHGSCSERQPPRCLFAQLLRAYQHRSRRRSLDRGRR
jgi:integrase/recombinase XerD